MSAVIIAAALSTPPPWLPSAACRRLSTAVMVPIVPCCSGAS